MARHSLENPLQQMPEHYGIGHGVATSVAKACDAFFRERGVRSYSMRDAVRKAAERGKRKKRDIG